MIGPPAGRRGAFLRYLAFLAWLELFATIVPGVLCASPLIFMELAKAVPVFGYAALVMLLPALLLSVYFMPSLRLIRMFMPYEPKTLKGGSLLPLPAYSPADWALVLGVHAAVIGVIWAACCLAFSLIRWASLRGESVSDAL